MTTKTVNKNEINVIGLHIECEFNDMVTEIPKAFNLLKSRMNEIGEVINSDAIIGFYPQESDETDSKRCHYYVSVEVKEGTKAPEGMIEITIPANKYISYEYKGPIEAYMKSAYGHVKNYMEEEGLRNNLKSYILEIKNWNNDMNDRMKKDNEVELLIPIF